MSLELAAKNNLKDLGEHMNEFKLVESVKHLILRVDKLEQRIIELESGSTARLVVKKNLTQVGRFEPYIHDILSDGKVWSTYTIEEEIRNRYPDIAPFKQLSVQCACGRLAKQGIIEKIATMHYRKKDR